MVETIDSPEVREAERIRKQRIIDENAAFLRGGGGANININVGGGGGGGANKKERTKNLAAEIADRVKQLGLTSFTTAEIANLAKRAVEENWSDTVIMDELLIGLDWENVTGGDLTAGADMLRQIAAGFLVPVNEAQAQDWSARIARGEMTQQGLTSTLQEQSRARYAWMAPLIDQGVKPADYFAPVKNMIADTLEVVPDSIDLMDPQWMGMLEVTDPKNGQIRGATLNEAMLAARKRPEWARTKSAQDFTAQVTESLGRMFGRAQ